ncbi:MAG: glycosyltransferase family 2 protein [Clostridia bacterium]|nr:glycosyltransferase family 2 protein [Clostridia bacterium]
MPLSVCLIVKDEEAVVSRCLNCVQKFADEIIVVDTGSADKTVEEVKKFTDKVYFYEWNDNFADARNYAFEKATGDFVMWLDADDVVPDEDCIKIKQLMEKADFDMAFLPYISGSEEGIKTFVYYRERIFRRSGNYKFRGAVHEAVTPQGNIVYSDAEIWHKKLKAGNSLRNLNILQKRIAHGICLNEREKFYYGRELLSNSMYREAIAVLEDFLRGNGWIENKIEACINLYGAYTAIGDNDGALNALLKSFTLAEPRSEACCILGWHFFEQNDVNCAIYWYQRALSNKIDLQKGGFVNLDYCAFIPNIQLCVLYDKLGDYVTANAYNEEAGKVKPHDKNYLINKQYFQNILGKEV